MAVKAKKKATSQKTATAPKAKAIAGKTADNGMEKAIISMSESIERLDRSLGEKIDKSLLAMTVSIAASDAKIAEANASIAASFAELDRVVERTKSQLAGLSDSYGLAVESLAYSYFDSRMTFAGVRFDDMETGVNRKRKLPDGTKIKGEYDTVLYNGTSIALIEAKNRVRKDHLEKLVDVQLPRFKLFYPQYKDYTYYLGICGMSFEDGVEAEALARGIGTLKPNGEAIEINETTVKAW
jgi:hypothetical protein